MGYLDKFVTLVIFAVIGWTFTLAEPPVRSYGSPKSSWSMMKSDMINSYSSVERVPMASSRVDTVASPGWTPYYGSSSSATSYQRSYRTTPAQTFQTNTYSAPPISNPQPSIDSYSGPPSVSSFPSTSYRAISQDSEPEFVRSATSYYPTVPAAAPAVSSYYSSAAAPSPSYGSETAPETSYGPGPAEKEVRFVIHKDGEEDQVRNTILMQFGMDDNISFLNGPMFKLQKKQKLFLPPKPKTIVYVLLRQPEINTETEVVPSTDDPKPEVRIIYQKPEGVQTKHYSPDSQPGPHPKPSGY